MKITKSQLKQIIKEALEGGIDQFADQYKVERLPAQFTNQQLIDFARQIDTNFSKFSPKLSTSKEAKPADMKSLEALLKLLTKRRAKEKDPKIQDEMQTVRLMLLDTINPDGDHREKYAYKQKMRADKLSRADRLTEPGRYGVYSKTPREELPTGAAKVRRFLGYAESLNRKQLEQIIREEIEALTEEGESIGKLMKNLGYEKSRKAVESAIDFDEDKVDNMEDLKALIAKLRVEKDPVHGLGREAELGDIKNALRTASRKMSK